MAIANQGSNNISILLGGSNGNFSSALNVATGSAPQSIVSADFNNDGKFDLTTANWNGSNCSVLLNCTIIGINDFAEEQKISIFPKPAQDFIFIEGLSECNYVEVMDATMKICKFQYGNHKKIDISTLEPGLYFIRIYSENRAFILKFIKE